MQEYEEELSNIQSVKIFGKNYDIQVEYAKIKASELNLKENYKIQIVLPFKYKKIGFTYFFSSFDIFLSLDFS